MNRPTTYLQVVDNADAAFGLRRAGEGEPLMAKPRPRPFESGVTRLILLLLLSPESLQPVRAVPLRPDPWQLRRFDRQHWCAGS